MCRSSDSAPQPPTGRSSPGRSRRPPSATCAARLLDRNLQPISIPEKKSILQFEITQKKVKKRELMHLCRQLAVFLRSGVSVLEALVVLADETSNKLLRSALDGMRASLESGARFSEAAAEHPELFPAYAVEILRSAELTGNLDEVLDQLADYLEREIETSHRVRSAMAYPLVVMGLAVVVIDRPGRLRAPEVPRFLLVAQRQAAPADPHTAGHGQVHRPTGA